ncbi:assimilatory nitrate reductase [Chitinimonas prasina]|uniref:Assimilatory nitrate reductase n=1 Tax=Chitinimonas prasina TaxID=1434937 RepID=A0ABQ5YCB7_9NEIS|nr:nitrate reductase [Chitinimonas prasina]GLR11247.1 assimilatory nitrate reductase [Chitinimonas prasina]
MVQPHIVKSTCCYCGTGCGVLIHTDGQQVLRVEGDPEHPANLGRLCIKGATLHLTDMRTGRAHYPELRQQRNDSRQRVVWDTALDHAAQRFAAIIAEHGPDAVAFYISGQLLTEDYYVFNKLAKGLIGTNNIDTNSRLCMSSTVAGYKATLGADAPPCSYEDLALADCLFIAGANPAYAHPVLFRRIEDAKTARPDMKIIVADPRRTDSAELADLHLPILPGTDVALFHAMLNVLVWEGWVDEAYIAAHTEGFAELKRRIREYTPCFAADICGIKPEQILQAAEWFGRSPRALSLWCMGLNQSARGTDKNAALIHLHLATGKLGKPGCGPFSLTGQPNAMGGREVGGMANLLSGHRDLANPAHRAEVAALWQVPDVPSQPGKTAVEMFEALEAGQIKAVWIACTNPAHSLPDTAQVARALQQAEFVVVQEAYAHTDTTAYADLLLPASSWGEKTGTVTNSERRITRLHAAVPAPGEARHDWQIAVDFARRLEALLPPRAAVPLFPYATPEAVFDEHKRSTAGRDLDISGLSYALLDSQGPQQWPYPTGAGAGQARLYADGRFPTTSGRARFVAVDYHPVVEKTDARYPLHLNTGRLRDQWHGMSRTGTVAQLYNQVEEPLLTAHPDDLAQAKLASGDLARVRSRRGELLIRVEASTRQRRGEVFLPMHWSGRFMAGQGSNALTLPKLDPQSRQPELKHAAIKLERVELPWQMVAMKQSSDAVQLMHRAADLLAGFDYGSVGLFGHDQPAVILKLAHRNAPSAEFIARLDAVFGFDDPMATLSYRDPRRGVEKHAEIRLGRLTGIRLTGETAARDWLKQLIAAGADAASLRPWLLAPLAAPPQGQQSRGKVICNCLNVSADEIGAALNQGCDLKGLQTKLACGTRCGSCLPELKRMVGSATMAVAV